MTPVGNQFWEEGDSGMAKEVLFLVEEAAEGGYIARALGHSIFTDADTWDELYRIFVAWKAPSCWVSVS